MEVALDHSMSLAQPHKAVHFIYDSVEHSVFEVKHCMVHVTPSA
ncbi:hypothetical protein [Oscillibacter sp.]